MLERKIICLDAETPAVVTYIKIKGRNVPVVHSYVKCNFDISSLPLKLNLPMIYPPRSYSFKFRNLYSHLYDKEFMCKITSFDGIGGYLISNNQEKGMLLACKDRKNFSLIYKNIPKSRYQSILTAFDYLMFQRFQINSHWLNYIKEHEELFVKHNLLVPSFYANLKPI
jgi:hypothetical protein